MTEYSFTDNILLINGLPITGFADGDDVVSGARNEDGFSHTVGAYGDMEVIGNPNRSGTFNIKLQQTSLSNNYLSDIYNKQESTSVAFSPVEVMFKNIRNGESLSGSLGYITKPANTTRGKGKNDQEWIIVVERYDSLFSTLAVLGQVGGALSALL